MIHVGWRRKKCTSSGWGEALHFEAGRLIHVAALAALFEAHVSKPGTLSGAASAAAASCSCSSSVSTYPLYRTTISSSDGLLCSWGYTFQCSLQSHATAFLKAAFLHEFRYDRVVVWGTLGQQSWALCPDARRRPWALGSALGPAWALGPKRTEKASSPYCVTICLFASFCSLFFPLFPYAQGAGTAPAVGTSPASTCSPHWRSNPDPAFRRLVGGTA